MRSRTLQLLAALAGFTLIWLFVRFPFEMTNLAGRLIESPDQVDPLTLHLRGEFVESNLGTAVNPDGSFTVRLIAQQYNFVPNCLKVPAGVPVRFRITSADAVHRFSIDGMDHDIEAVPWHVSESQFQFNNVGEYKTPCHEFCGAGHYDMRSRLVVVARDQFPQLTPQERLTCAAP